MTRPIDRQCLIDLEEALYLKVEDDVQADYHLRSRDIHLWIQAREEKRHLIASPWPWWCADD